MSLGSNSNELADPTLARGLPQLVVPQLVVPQLVVPQSVVPQ